MVQASLPPNPSFSFSRVCRRRSSSRSSGRSSLNILSLATLPARAEIAADRFRQAQLRAAEETLRVAAETRRAFYRAVAARELAGFLDAGQDGGRDRDPARQAPRRNRRGEQARSGARSRCSTPSSPRSWRLARQRVDQRARAADARARPLGRRSRFSSCPARCRALPARPRALAGDRGRGGAPPGRSARSRASRSRRWRSPTVSPARPASSICWRSAGISKTSADADGAQRHASAASRSSSRCRCSISARCVVRQAEASYMQAVNRLDREGGQRPLRGARRLSAPIASSLRHRAALPARGSAAAQDHLGRNAAALQRHADRRVRAAGRGAPAHRLDHAPRSKPSAISGSPTPNLAAAIVGGGGMAAPEAATALRRRRRKRPAAALKREPRMN